jgi:exopolyphosphatase
MEVFFDGKMITLNDYKSMKGYGVKLASIETKGSEKGQLEELEAFGKAIKEGREPPISLWQQVQAMQIAFAVEAQI